MAEKFYDVPEAATVLGLTPDTMRRWLRAGRVRGMRLGRDWRIPVRAIDELAQGTTNQGDDVDALLDATGDADRRAGYRTEADVEQLIAEVRAELGHDAPRRALRRARLRDTAGAHN